MSNNNEAILHIVPLKFVKYYFLFQILSRDSVTVSVDAVVYYRYWTMDIILTVVNDYNIVLYYLTSNASHFISGSLIRLWRLTTWKTTATPLTC